MLRNLKNESANESKRKPRCVKAKSVIESCLKTPETPFTFTISNGTYISANRAAERLSGYTREEIVGHNFTEFVAADHTRQVRENFCLKLAQKGETTYEVDVIAKDGRRVPVEVSSRAIYENGIVVGVQGMARDITERKLAQDALQMFSRQLIEAQEDERRRIARELHDQIGQVLTAVKMNLHTVQQVQQLFRYRLLCQGQYRSS